MQLSAFLSLLLVATTFAYPVTHNLQRGGAHTHGLLDANTGSTGSDGVLDISGRDLEAYKNAHELLDRDLGDESLELLARAAGSVTYKASMNRKFENELKEYLEKIPANKVEVQFGPMSWKPWHGDNKSQAVPATTAHAFQTKGFSNGASYTTRVTPKNSITAFLEYTSPEKEDAQTIVNALIAVLR